MTAPKIAFNDPPLSLLVRNPKMDIERRRKTYYHMLPQAKPAMGTAMNATMETANLRKSPSKPKPTSTQRSPPQCRLVVKMEHGHHGHQGVGMAAARAFNCCATADTTRSLEWCRGTIQTPDPLHWWGTF